MRFPARPSSSPLLPGEAPKGYPGVRAVVLRSSLTNLRSLPGRWPGSFPLLPLFPPVPSSLAGEGSGARGPAWNWGLGTCGQWSGCGQVAAEVHALRHPAAARRRRLARGGRRPGSQPLYYPSTPYFIAFLEPTPHAHAARCGLRGIVARIHSPARRRSSSRCCGLRGIVARIHYTAAGEPSWRAVACGESSLGYTNTLPRAFERLCCGLRGIVARIHYEAQ